MTQNTSSSSADGTTEDSKPGPTGKPDTEMISAIIFEAVGQHHHRDEKMTDWQFRWWAFKVRLRHAVGIHTLVPTEEWFHEEGQPRMRYTGLRCWRCEYWEP
jgi:hypothetical protein